MSIDVDNAVYARWNAASLNTLVASLFPGDDVPSPEGTSLPRANYYTTNDPLESESRSTLTNQKNVTFEAWGDNYETVAGYVKTIKQYMLNSENSATNPLKMVNSTGAILGTHKTNEGIDKADDALFRGFFEMLIRWRENKAIP
jgi:hypothetical protein